MQVEAPEHYRQTLHESKKIAIAAVLEYQLTNSTQMSDDQASSQEKEKKFDWQQLISKINPQKFVSAV